MDDKIKHIQKQLVSPLNIIMGFTQLLEMDNNLTPSQLETLSEIKNSGQLLSDLIKQLPELITEYDNKHKPQIDSIRSHEKILAEQTLASSRKILIVEDNLTNQKLLVQQLEILGYESDTANDGQFALEKLSNNYYGLILTDLNMPRIDGYQLTQKIRENMQWAEQIIIAITANALVGEKEKCLQLGMDGYLSKPLNINDLKALLKKWIKPPNETIVDQTQTQTLSEELSEEIAHDNDGLNTQSILDKSFLVRSLGDNKQKHLIIINSYLQHAPEIVDNFNQAYADRDLKNIRFYAHKLKSSSRSIGATMLADSNHEIEQAADAGNWQIIDQLSPQIKTLFEEVRQALDNDYKGLLKLNSDKPPANQPANSEKNSIMVIDDDQFILSQMLLILDDLGYSDIITVNHAPKALELIKSSLSTASVDVISLVICDLNMPEMDGISFLRHLAELSFTGQVILISGEDKRVLKTASELAKGHQLNIIGTIEKPINREDLAGLLLNKETKSKLTRDQLKPATIIKEQPVVTIEKLAYAIKEKKLVVYYQPQIEIKTNKVIGVESLVRWIDSAGVFIPPDQFIPIAEENNLIESLTDLVVEQSFSQLSQWKSQGMPLKVAINFSIDSFNKLDFPEQFLAKLKAFNLNPSDIILEVTERRLMDNVLNVFEVLTRLRLNGFGLSIDDFGTGYSTMEQLQKLPFTELKLDQSFVNGALKDSTSKAILESSIGLAKKIELSTVAEGIETMEDIELVKSLDCDFAQGYYIARPMPADKFTQWYSNWEKERMEKNDNSFKIPA